MIHVLVLEDDRSSLEALEKILSGYSSQLRVHTAASYEEARARLDEPVSYGLFLLDVNLGGTDREDIGGILFAREIRERFRYTFTPIVMVTAVGAMEMQAYRELHCYQYLMKPYRKEQVEEILEKVLEQGKSEKPPEVLIKKEGVNYQVRCDDIRYIEAIPRGIRLHLRGEDWDVPYLTIRQLLPRLPEGQFLQTHRMYVVNRREVEYYDLVNRVVKLKGQKEQVEIGVTYRAEIGRLLHD